jgi:hypothetical protein
MKRQFLTDKQTLHARCLQKTRLIFKKISLKIYKISLRFKKISLRFLKISLIFKKISLRFLNISLIFKKISLKFWVPPRCRVQFITYSSCFIGDIWEKGSVNYIGCGPDDMGSIAFCVRVTGKRTSARVRRAAYRVNKALLKHLASGGQGGFFRENRPRYMRTPAKAFY